MNPNSSSSGAEASNSRKRKVVVKKEDEASPSAPPQPSSLTPSLQRYVDTAMLAVSTNLSLASSPLPKSFVALLTQDDDEYTQLLKHQMYEIDNLIRTQNENIRGGLQDLWNETVEKMNKKVKEKEVEASIMKQIAECHKNNSQEWQVKAMASEQALASLRTAMHETLESMAHWRRPGQREEDEAESSFENRGPMELRVKCKMCDKKPAKVMMWPCRHVSVCLSCEAMARDCPLCGAIKECYYKVNLS